MTRILHTSDWHLGATLDGASRDDEHALFLPWLEDKLREEAIDVLIVAGDVFDQSQPSAEAQRMYYGFLHRVAMARSVRKVVIVGGNHDSPSRLDAPRELLSVLDVHVVGGLQSDRDTWERCLCTVPGADGGIDAVIAAVPFVHEYKLGVKTVLQDPSAVRDSFEQEFRGLYSHLVDRAAELAPGAPIVATGHLASGAPKKEDGDWRSDVHMIGSIGALPPSIFDPRIAYVALGHIHRSYPVGDRRAWYSGTPIPMSFAEAKLDRKVLIADVAKGAEASVRAVPVPRWRALIELEGDVLEVSKVLRELTWPDHELPPLIRAQLLVDRYTAGLEGQLHQALEANPRKGAKLLLPQQRVRVTAGAASSSATLEKALRELEPLEVFERLCKHREHPLDDALRNAFLSLVSEPSEQEVGT